MIAVTLILLTILCMLIVSILRGRSIKDIDKIPGPKPLPLIGNIFEFGNNTTDQLKNQLRLVKEYGPIIRIWFGWSLTIILTDVEKVEYILSSNVHINKSKNYNNFQYWFGQSLLTSKGEYWRKHRKLITPSFHFKLVEGFSEYINSNGKILVDKFHEKINEKSIDIYPLINLYALDVILESAMQTKVNAQQNSDSNYVEAVKGFLIIHVQRFFSFFQKFDKIFKLTSDYKKMMNFVNTLRGFTENVIRLRKEERKSLELSESEDQFGIKRKKVFLDHLLDMQEKENLFTDEEITNLVDNFTFAGHDTVASAVSFCLYELSKHPEIQEKLLEESNDVVGEGKEKNLNFRDISRMIYLDRVFKESMRLKSPVPFIERELETDVTFDGVNVPKGTTIHILIYAMHMNEKYFPEPEKFDPDRFLPENVKTRNPFTYIPFSAGARNCIGFRYAQSFAKTTIAYILRNFKILPSMPEIKPILCNNVILESENGIHVRLEPR